MTDFDWNAAIGALAAAIAGWLAGYFWMRNRTRMRWVTPRQDILRKLHPSFMRKVRAETLDQLAERSWGIVQAVRAQPARLPVALLQQMFIVVTVLEQLREERARSFETGDEELCFDQLRRDVKLLEALDQNPALINIMNASVQLHAVQREALQRKAGVGGGK